MADLGTTYMGLELKNPIVVGSCSLSLSVDTGKQIEEAGAGALVIKSLFEEQVQLEQAEFEEKISSSDEIYAEMISMFPNTKHGGAKEYLHLVNRLREAMSIPLIASLNATEGDVWVEYAKKLAETGVDGLELNFYSLSLDAALASEEIEKRELEIFSRVKEAVDLPVAVKLHPYYTNMLRMAAEFDRRGANAIVIFNRLFQPDINVEDESEYARLRFSQSGDSAVALRWTALLFGRIRADIVSNTGIMTGEDVIKMLLAGASSIQVVSTLYQNGVGYINGMLTDLREWMDRKDYKSLSDFRGKASKSKTLDPWSFERAQYIKALLGFD